MSSLAAQRRKAHRDNSMGLVWCTRGDSNARLLAPEASALSTELRVQITSIIISHQTNANNCASIFGVFQIYGEIGGLATGPPSKGFASALHQEPSGPWWSAEPLVGTRGLNSRTFRKYDMHPRSFVPNIYYECGGKNHHSLAPTRAGCRLPVHPSTQRNRSAAPNL